MGRWKYAENSPLSRECWKFDVRDREEIVSVPEGKEEVEQGEEIVRGEGTDEDPDDGTVLFISHSLSNLRVMRVAEATDPADVAEELDS